MPTLAQFRTTITSKLGLDNTASSAEQSLVDGWVNEGVIRVLLDTKCNVDKSTSTLTANQPDYTLDAAILQITEMNLTAVSDSTVRGLEPVSPAEILSMRRGASSSSSPSYYALEGNDLLLLYPTPSAADTLTIYYVPRPTALSAAGNDPSSNTYGGVPAEYHKAIEYWALYQAAEYTDHRGSGYGEAFFARYQRELALVRRAMPGKAGRRKLGRAVVGRRLQRYRPHDPSTDTGV